MSVSGSFKYDASIAPSSTAGDGSTIYSAPPTAPYTAISATVGSYSLSDPRGFVQVANDKPISIFPAADFVQLYADSSNNALGTHNISGFSIGGYTLFNMRMFWIEGSTTPELIPDFLSNQNLPAVLPHFHGRLSLDFVETGNPSGPQSDVFFDRLTVAAVPEPETYAMLLAGLGMLGFAARRRARQHAAAA